MTQKASVIIKDRRPLPPTTTPSSLVVQLYDLVGFQEFYRFRDDYVRVTSQRHIAERKREREIRKQSQKLIH